MVVGDKKDWVWDMRCQENGEWGEGGGRTGAERNDIADMTVQEEGRQERQEQVHRALTGILVLREVSIWRRRRKGRRGRMAGEDNGVCGYGSVVVQTG